jgi:8-oxo-dGTP diphosphatase
MEFPGGKVLGGESYLEAARRELGEELGIEVVEAGSPIFSAADPDSPFIIHFIEARIRGKPRPREHTRLRWAAIEELGALPLAPADARFVRACLERLPRSSPPSS